MMDRLFPPPPFVATGRSPATVDIDEAATRAGAVAREAISLMWRESEDRSAQILGLRKLIDVDSAPMKGVSQSDVHRAVAEHEAIAGAVLDGGGFRTIVQCLKMHQDDGEVYLRACRALQGLVVIKMSDGSEKAGPRRLAAITEARGVPSVVQGMARQADNADVQAMGCSTLSLFLKADTNLKQDAIAEGILDVVIAAMASAQFSEDVQASSCMLLPHLIDTHDQFAVNRIFRDVFSALDLHFHSAPVQHHGWNFLASLGANRQENWNLVSVLGKSEVLSLLSKAITRHSADMDTTKELRAILQQWINKETEAADQETDSSWLRELAEYAAEGRLEIEADEVYELAISSLPQAGAGGKLLNEMYASRSLSKGKAAKWQDAFEDAKKCTEANKEWATGWHRLGSALDGLGRHVEAVEALTQAVNLEKDRKLRVTIQDTLQEVLERMASKWQQTAERLEKERAQLELDVEPLDGLHDDPHMSLLSSGTDKYERVIVRPTALERTASVDLRSQIVADAAEPSQRCAAPPPSQPALPATS